MDNELLIFPARVEVISPVHVGSGEKISLKSFVFDIKNRQIAVVDEARLIRRISENPQRTSAFMQFAESPGARLGDFVSKHNFALEELTSYRLTCHVSDEGTPQEVMAFIKTADGKPYLPGSSLKGALRSALLRGVMLEQSGVVGWANKNVDQLVQKRSKQASKKIERHVFVPNRDAPESKASNYDLLRALSVSDSTGIAINQIEAAEVRILSSQSNRTLKFKSKPHGDRLMLVYAEMLRPGTRLDLTLTFNQSLLVDTGAARELGFASRSAMLTDIGKYCRLAVGNLIKQEITFYQKHGQHDLASWFTSRLAELEAMEGTICLLPIGWGTGYDAKTITDLLNDSVFEAVVSNYKNTKRLGKPGGSGKWLGPQLSPKTRKVVRRADGSFEPIGWIRLKF